VIQLEGYRRIVSQVLLPHATHLPRGGGSRCNRWQSKQSVSLASVQRFKFAGLVNSLRSGSGFMRTRCYSRNWVKRQSVCQLFVKLGCVRCNPTELNSVGDAKDKHSTRSTRVIPCPFFPTFANGRPVPPGGGGFAIPGTLSSQDRFLVWNFFTNKAWQKTPTRCH
jgi:hypothetical protein